VGGRVVLPGGCLAQLEAVRDPAWEWRREREEAGLPTEPTEVVWFTGPEADWFW
jgi:hypothetical protein